MRQIGKIYDAADICKRFNGGGHPGAAGFVANSLHFYDMRPLPTSLKYKIDEEINRLLIEIYS